SPAGRSMAGTSTRMAAPDAAGAPAAAAGAGPPGLAQPAARPTRRTGRNGRNDRVMEWVRVRRNRDYGRPVRPDHDTPAFRGHARRRPGLGIRCPIAVCLDAHEARFRLVPDPVLAARGRWLRAGRAGRLADGPGRGDLVRAAG